MPKLKKIDSMELPDRSNTSVKQLSEQAFHWQFTDYAAFSNQGLDGGFCRNIKTSYSDMRAAVPVFYSNTIAAAEQTTLFAGGVNGTPAYSFQQRLQLHLCNPGGNECSAWTDLGADN